MPSWRIQEDAGDAREVIRDFVKIESDSNARNASVPVERTWLSGEKRLSQLAD